MTHVATGRLLSAYLLLVLQAHGSAQDHQVDPSERTAPIVISYSPDGVQLTSTLINGLLQGCVGERVHAKLRGSDPDWPRVRLLVRQEEADQRQPAGFFSGLLVAVGSGDQARNVLGEAAAILQDELDSRMHTGPAQESAALRERAAAALHGAEEDLAAQRAALLEVHGGAREVEERMDHLNQELVRLRMEVHANEPLIEVEQRQSARLDAQMRDLAASNASLDAESADLEAQLAGDPRNRKLRQRLLEVQAAREQTTRKLDQITDNLQNTSASVQERSSRLLEMRAHMDALSQQMDEASARLSAERSGDRKRLDLQRVVEKLEADRQQRRQELAELERSANQAVPVRVQLWY
ncbi:MAG: hypothetical protein R3F56_00735 [Planctomycetota bacterium]